MGDGGRAGLTPLELQIMQVIWRQRTSSVSEVREGLEQRLAYTTVQTMLNILERKGKLRRAARGRAFEYTAALSEAGAVRQAVGELVERMFGGSHEELMMSLLSSRELDREQIARLSKRLDEAKQSREAGDVDDEL